MSAVQHLTDLDLARAYAQGLLAGPLRAEVERRLRDDPEFADLASLFSSVWTATEQPLPARPARPAPSFTEPPASRVPARPVVWAAAAAALLAVGLWAWRGPGRGEPEPSGPVLLGAIPLEPVVVKEVPPPPAEELERYSPSDGAGVRLVDGIERGLALSRAAGKPLLVFFYAPQCPSCVEVATGPLLDDSVASAAAPYVVARQDVGEAPPPVLRELRHLPGFAVYDREGFRSASFPATPEVEPLVERLKAEAESHARAHGPGRSWDAVHEIARDLLAAADERDSARRRALWEKVSAADPDGALGDAARARLQREKADARFALLAAKAAAEASGPGEAVRVLDDALARLRGTRYEADLVAVRDRVARDGAFPALQAAR